MYDLIEGMIIKITPTTLVIKTGGIGYKITVPSKVTQHHQLQDHLMVYVSFIIRENLQQLYGFLKEEERDLFDLLLTVSKVGPKLSLSIIEHASPHDLASWVITKNTVALSKIPGLGKKTAEKMILELKDKLNQLPTSCGKSAFVHDATKALIALGFNAKKAEEKVRSLKESLQTDDVETLVAQALKNP